MSHGQSRRSLVVSAVMLSVAASLPLGGFRSSLPVAAGGTACTAESEPNDTPADAPVISGDFCQSGTLPENDQDLVVWEVPPAAALFPWTFRVDGVPRTITSIHVLPVTSAPDAASTTVGAEVARIDSDSESREPGIRTDIALEPGRYVLGISKGTNTGPTLESFDYQVVIEQPDPGAPVVDAEPNDVPEQASPVEGDFAVLADLVGSADVFRWKIDEADAGLAFDLDARALAGPSFSLTLEDDAGVELATAFLGADSHARLYDLRLPAGAYQITMGPGAAEPRPYVLSAIPTTDPNADPEPNNDAARAVPIAPGAPVLGRLAGSGDKDVYRVSVDAALAATQLDIRLSGGPGLSRQVCVYGPDGTLLHCRQDQGGLVTLSNLLLPIVGEYTLEVSGADSLTQGYTLGVDDIGPVAADREVEPDDSALQASPLDVLQPLHGRADGIDDDVYRARVSGAPQLWRLDVAGDGVEELALMREDTIVLATGGLAPGGGRLVLRDLWLLPGDHWLRIRGRDTDYTVTFTPLGQPPENGELEPNNESNLAASMIPGEWRVGRLTDAPDVNVYRFSLAAAEHLVILLDPPTDGSVALALDSSGTRIAEVPAGEPGDEVRYEAGLPAGDYELWLRPGQLSEDRYTLALERLDPFTDGVTPVDPPAVSLELTTDVAAVAGWWSDGQRVGGQLTITSTGTADQRLTLDARPTDDAWSVELPPGPVDVLAGATVTLPLAVHVPVDAWADVPVRITIAAADASGARATAFAEVTPHLDVAPVAPETAWSLPSALLGGLNVAASALGAVPVPGPDPALEALLFDGYAVPGFGYQGSLAGGPVTVGVDLAGDAPLPIAGFILDPLAVDPALAWRPRDVEVLLSDNGVDYQVALTAQLSPVMREQAFVLDQPVPARFAQLRISSSWGGASGTVALGEWKVVAQPGAVPDTAAPINLADPARGGHVVALESLPTDDVAMGGMLTEDPTAWLPNPADATTVRWMVGFRDDRVAAITELQWVDSPGVDPAALIASVDVEVSTATSLGPWEPVMTWTLERGGDGSVTPLTLPDPVWARFLRFTTTGPAVDNVVWAMPATLRVLERPTDGRYRSILGEWGRWERRGIMELLEPVAGVPPPVDDAPGGDDDPATATPLGIGEVAAGQVRRGVDGDWYVLTMPPGQDLLTLTVGGEPFAAAGVSLFEASGSPVELEALVREGRTTVWTALVEPEATYHVLVEQLPVSTAFTYDSSGSMIHYLPFIADALRTFAGGLVPGLDAAMVIPFEEAPLLDDWSDDPIALQGAVAAETTFPAGSSAVEKSMLAALGELGRRPGTRALVVLTDAETTSRGQAPDVWAELERLRPLVFTVHMGDLEAPAIPTHLMQDWAASTAGTYGVTVSHREIDRTFQRIAAWLRRPAAYSLSATTAAIPKEPGSLRLIAATPRAGTVGGVTIELVLDTSGSMLTKLGPVRRIDVARSVLTRLVTETLPPGIAVALRTFRAKAKSCETVIAEPLGPLDPAAMAARIKGLKVVKSARTPLGATLHAVGDDLDGVEGKAIVVFVTDGQETCKGDPAAEIRRLIALGIDVQVNIVGFAIDDPELTADIVEWARLGNGTAYDADSEDELILALTGALRAPFSVYDADGTPVASGVVGGDRVPLPVGTYRVEVQTEPPVTLKVVIGSGTNVEQAIGEE